MNGVCGSFSIFSSARYLLTNDDDYLWSALAFPLAGLMFDFFDGKVARWRNSSSMLGQELDSLADLVSTLDHFWFSMCTHTHACLDLIRCRTRVTGVCSWPANLSRHRLFDMFHLLRFGPSGSIQRNCRTCSKRFDRESAVL